MSIGQLGVLHTYAEKYNTSEKPSLPNLASAGMNYQDLIGKMIQDLKDKEDAFANRMGFSDCEQMIKEIRNILGKNPADLQALQQFSADNLRAHLHTFQQRNANLFEKRRINLRFTVQKSHQEIDSILQQIRGEFSSGPFTVNYHTDGTVTIGVVWNTGAIKALVNRLDNHQLKTHSMNIEELMNILYNNTGNLLNVTIGAKNQQSIQSYVLNNFNNPFALKKQELDGATKQQLIKLKKAIQNFILNDLCGGCSPQFKQAVQLVAGQRLIPTVDNLMFFEGGDAWITHMVGAGGELQTAILFQYIGTKTSNPQLQQAITNILGDKKNAYSQDLHTDLEIFNQFGIQVKNYNGDINRLTGEKREITVNLHPSEIQPLSGTSVVDYIANSYFNTSNEQYSEGEWKDFFREYGPELLNLDGNTNLPDKVTFYMIGGNFIPGSVILTHAYIENDLNVETTINNPDSGGDDESFNPWLKDRKAWHSPFIKWWKSNSLPPQEGDFSPTAENTIGAWDKRISIRTTFEYSALWDGKYKLF